MKKHTSDRPMATRRADKDPSGGQRARRSSRTAPGGTVVREGGLRRASRWFITGLAVAYGMAIVWTSLTYAYTGGYSGQTRGPVAGRIADATTAPLRVVFRRGSRFAEPGGPLGAASGRLSPLGVRAYVESAAKAAGVSPNAAEWIVAHESSHRPLVTGDGGESRGLWQISRIYHPEVSDRCAYDVKCSTSWSLRRILGGNINEWSTWKYRRRLANSL